MDNTNYFKNYYNKNQDTILERLFVNQSRRYKVDIEFKFLTRKQVMIKIKLPKYVNTVKQLLGCSILFY